MVDNYGWIDYSQCTFSLEKFDIESVTNWRVVDDFLDFVPRRAKLDAFDDFMCTPRNLEHWENEHTWRVPPVVLDVSSLPPIPDHADIGGAFQLIEGHNRLGYFCSARRCKKPLNNAHYAYVLRCSS